MGLFYSTSDLWADIIPIAQDDGGPNPLAAIAYTGEYSEAMSYLRAVMAREEKSPRVLLLTEDIIGMNPAHYTVWLYRASVLFALGSDLHQELAWLDGISLDYLKNYQIWHHRHLIMKRMTTLPKGEPAFLARVLAKDAKNYHVWSYRQWLVRNFALWDSELPAIEDFLRDDVRNNSAWNHRWFIIFGRVMDPAKDSIVELNRSRQRDESETIAEAKAGRGGGEIEEGEGEEGEEGDEGEEGEGEEGEEEGEEKEKEKEKEKEEGDQEKKRGKAKRTPTNKSSNDDPSSIFHTIPASTIEREITYSQSAIRLAPQNPSPWNYLRGILKVRSKASSSRSSHAMDGSSSITSDRDSDSSSPGSLTALIAFAEEFAIVKEGLDSEEGEEGEERPEDRLDSEETKESGGEVRSSHALEFLADYYARRGEIQRAGKALEMLAVRYDPVRKNYWDWKRGGLGIGVGVRV